MRNSWDAYFTRYTNPNLLRLQICTGDATFIVREALRNYQYAMRIIIIAFAPSCMISSDLCLQVVHYRSSWDIISARGGTTFRTQNTLIVPRHPESRGLLDHEVMSSTFFLIMEMETLCFHTRQVLVDMGVFLPSFNRGWSRLRNIFIHDNAPNFQIRERRRRGALASFLARYPTVTIPAVAPVNLWESCLSEAPRNELEVFIRGFVLFRNGALLLTMVVTLCLCRQLIPNRVWPLLVSDTLLAYRFVYLNLRRAQDGGSVGRTLVLRSGWLDVVQWFYELVVLGSLHLDSSAPGFLYAILGVRVVFTGINLTNQYLVALISPLRGRIDSHWHPLDEGDIYTENAENRPAMRTGLIRRIGRAATQITNSVASITVAGILIYTAFFPPEIPFSEDSLDPSPTPPANHDEFTPPGMFAVISGIVSAASFIQNVIQWRRIARRLRDDDIPPSETEARLLSEEIELHILLEENPSDGDSDNDGDEEGRLLPDD